MGRLQSSVGLVTGTDIQGTVDQLIAISARPRDRLVARTDQLRNQQAAISSLTALVIGVQLSGQGLGNQSVFEARNSQSSNSDALSVSADSKAPVGDYTIRTLAKAATHTVTSRQRFDSVDAALGLEGTISIAPDGFLAKSVAVSELNEGRGIESGRIRITDRSGQSAEVDLTDVRDFDDVIAAINDAEVDVRATTIDGAIQLTDLTGETLSNLKVEQLGSAETAADLGLWGIDEASSTVTGHQLTSQTDVTSIEDVTLGSLGVTLDAGQDLTVTLADDSTLEVLISRAGVAEIPAEATTDNVDANAQVTIEDSTGQFQFDGLSVSFVDDPSLVDGPSVALIGEGEDQRLEVSFRAGTDDANAIIDAINNADLGLTASPVGDGSGFVSADDTATLAGTRRTTEIPTPQTVGELVERINQIDPSELTAAIVDDQIVLTDLTSGNGSFTLTDVGGANIAAALGFAGPAEDGTIGSNTIVGLTKTLSDGPLRGVLLDDLNGGSGLGSLTDLDITLSDGSSASVDLSGASTTAAVIDAIDAAGLDLIVGLNDAQTGFRIRDVSGGTGNLQVSSSDDTAAKIGLVADTTSDIVVGSRLDVQTVTADTNLADLNDGNGPTSGAFTITDSDGVKNAVNLTVDEIETVGQLIDRINSLSVNVTASINDAGDGISIVDLADGPETLVIEDQGSGEVAAGLGFAGNATVQTVNDVTASALVGTQSDVIEITADDTLTTIAEKISNGKYGTASIKLNDDGSYSLGVRSDLGGEVGQFGVNIDGFNLDLQTSSRGQDALISVVDADGAERFYTSTDGVFAIDNGDTGVNGITASTSLDELGAGSGSFVLTDSLGNKSGVNVTVDGLKTVGELVDKINSLGLGLSASINEDGTGFQIIDTAGGSEELVIEDIGNGIAAASLGIEGTAEVQTIGVAEVNAIVGQPNAAADEDAEGLVFTLKELSDEPITVSVTEDTEAVVRAANAFVSQYNRLVDQLETLTFFNADDNEVGLLFGSSEALRIDSGYSRLLTGSIRGAGEISSLGEVGLRLNGEGKLELNESKLSDAIAEKKDSVVDFFTTEDTGLVARLDGLAERLAGESNSLLLTRTQTLTSRIERNEQQVEFFGGRLEAERERLLKQFFDTEEAIAKLQANQSAVSEIQPITIPE